MKDVKTGQLRFPIGTPGLLHKAILVLERRQIMTFCFWECLTADGKTEFNEGWLKEHTNVEGEP